MVDRARNLRVQLSDVELMMLHALADDSGLSSSDVVRTLVRESYRSKLGGRPVDEVLREVCDRARFYVWLARLSGLTVRGDREKRTVSLADGGERKVTVPVIDAAQAEDAVYHAVRGWPGSKLTAVLERLGLANGSSFDFVELGALFQRWRLDPEGSDLELAAKGRARGR